MGKFIDRTGNRYGRLTVIERGPNDRHNRAQWLCECSCPARTRVLVQGGSLHDGNTTSCGCRRLETLTSHGHHNTATYRSWTMMKQRCHNPKATGFHNYGGRGITVCARWRNSFENFLADMGERPANTTLDRLNPEGGNYEPGNCRWATHNEQRCNRRANAGTLLSEAQAREVRASSEKGVVLAARYGVSATCISNIRNGKTFRNLA